MAGKVQGRFGRRWAIGINVGVNGVMFAVTAVTTEVWLVAPALLIGDFGGPLWGIAVLSLQARVVPDGLRGRVGSAYRFVSFGAMAVGAAIGGVAAEVVGTRAMFAGCAVVTLAMLVPFARMVTERAMGGKSD
jgi:MFS family permease